MRYIYELGKSKQKFHVAPVDRSEALFFAHCINHADEGLQNCEIDNDETGVIRAKISIEENEELTLNYGEDYWEMNERG